MKRTVSKLFAIALALAMALSFMPGQTRLVSAASPDVVISQVYGGGGNNQGVFTNDFVELFNRGSSPISLAGWSIQYASATGTGNFGANSGQLTPLSGTIAPGQYILVQEAAGSNIIAQLPTPDVTDSTPINMSGTGGKVALVTSSTSLGCNGGSTPCSAAQLALIKDLVGWDGANFFEGVVAPATTNSTAILRKSDGAQDTDNNADDFVAATPNPRNSSYPLIIIGLATPNVLFTGDATSLTVAVSSAAGPLPGGISVSCDLAGIGRPGAQTFYDDGTNGDITAGDSIFTFSTTVSSSATGGSKTLPCTVSDSLGDNRLGTITVTITAILPIGTVNGPVQDFDNGTTHASSFVGQIVTIQGVIYEKTLQATSFGTPYNGFFIQNTAATADGDLNTSDGLFVFMSTFTSLIGGYTPVVGDEVVLSGKVTEYYNMTELSSASMLKLVRSGMDVDAEVAPVVADPPTPLVDANRYWERLQGMRVQVPQDSIVLGGRNVFNPADAEIWVARPDSTIAQRADPYTRRAFRDAHPLDDNYDPNSWDGNGYRILMGSLGIKYTAGDAQTLIDPARTFSTLTNSPAGGLNYTFSKYRIEISEQPTFNLGVDPAANNPPEAADRAAEYNIVDYNLENLYDYRDNPFSGCDFNNSENAECSKTGTPFLSDVTPSYDYVPASEAAYQARLTDIAKQIINDLHSPDILMVQEVENQDICSVTNGAYACGTTDNADGKPDVLQELALKIASQGGPAYDAAFDRDSSDLRGIAPAFLYRTDRVQLLPAAGDPVLGANPVIGSYTGVPANADVSNPKTFNAVLPAGVAACETSWVFPRAPDVGLFRIFLNHVGGSYRDVYVLNNHFKSGPDSCVAHRTEQAKYNAALVAFIQAANPEARVVVGGDFNVYPRPDDITLGATDQLGSLYDPAIKLKNLWEVLLGQAPESAYSYVYLGQAQTLDQMFVNEILLNDLQQFRIAHINSDFAADYPGDVARGTSDHDPNAATFLFNTFDFTGFFQPVDNGALNVVKAGSGIPVKFSLGGDMGLSIFGVGYPKSTKFVCDTSEPSDAIEQTVTAGASSLQYDPLTGQYTYVWKTDKAWAGTCRQLVIKLTDGNFFTADFKFTK